MQTLFLQSTDREYENSLSDANQSHSIMTKEFFNSMVKWFFKAVKEKTLLIIIDSSSKNGRAVFSLVSFNKKKNASSGYIDYANMLKELGFKNSKDDSLFVTYCAGRYSLYILDNIGHALKGKNIRLPKGWYDMIQYQNCI